MAKLIIDGFEDKFQTYNFALWIKEQINLGKVRFKDIGPIYKTLDFDGFDNEQSSGENIHIDICVYELEDEDE